MLTDDEIRKEVNAKTGQTIGTVWGPCTVIGLTVSSVNQSIPDLIELREDKDEFVIKLQDWNNCQAT